MERRNRSSAWVVTGALLLVGVAGPLPAAAAPPQGPSSGPVQVTSAALLPGPTPQTFTLRLSCESVCEYATFWVGAGRTFVVDVRNAYTPFRGQAVGELNVSGVHAVRASQFLEAPEPIARFELETAGGLATVARWVGHDLEIAFGPGDYTFRGTGRTQPPGSGAAAVPAPGAVPPAAQTPPPAVAAAADTTRAASGYRAGGRDNPFDPLLKPPENPVDRTRLELRDLPDSEGLTLTGIVFLEDRPSESVALLRDAAGFTYRFHKGDRVKFGVVTQITKSEIYFALDKYGRQYEFKLSLKRNQR
jgi:hypothetical protein